MPQNLSSLSRRIFQTGTLDMGPFARPELLNGFKITVERQSALAPTSWTDPASILTIEWDCSYDGGTTWQTQGSASHHGGILLDPRSGAEIPTWETTFEFDPRPTHVRGRLIVENGPVRTKVDVDAMESSTLKKLG